MGGHAYTEDYSVCQFARQAGWPVRVFEELIAYDERPAGSGYSAEANRCAGVSAQDNSDS